MHPELERKRVRDAFGAAAERYDAAAGVQRAIAMRLATMLTAERFHRQAWHAGTASHILDAGCGTGHASQLLLPAHPDAKIMSLDAAFGMCAKIKGPTVCADIEQLPFRTASFDMYWSSLAWQWTTPRLGIREAARVLKPGAVLAVATLGPGTLGELRDAFRSVDHERHVRDFIAPTLYREWLEEAGFPDPAVSSDSFRVHADSVRELLLGIRKLGANTVGAHPRPRMLGRSAWNRLVDAYENWREPEGLRATYDAVFIVAKKG